MVNELVPPKVKRIPYAVRLAERRTSRYNDEQKARWVLFFLALSLILVVTMAIVVGA